MIQCVLASLWQLLVPIGAVKLKKEAKNVIKFYWMRVLTEVDRCKNMFFTFIQIALYLYYYITHN